MIKKLQLGLLVLIAGAICAVFYRAGSSDSKTAVELRAPTQAAPKGEAYPPTDAGGSDLTPAAQAIAAEDANGSGFTEADFTAHVEQLKKKLPSDDFTIVVQQAVRGNRG